MSPGDLLLQWVSCFHELRVARVQAAAERLYAPPLSMTRDDPKMAPTIRYAKRLMRNLVRLGHLEEFTADRFRTVPPTIVIQQGDRYLLVGARSEALRQSLSKFSGLSIRPVEPQRYGPAVWYIDGTVEAIVVAATTLGIKVARDRGTDLLASLPRLSGTLEGASPEGIPDKTERWNADAPFGPSRWTRTKADGHAPGLYCTIRKPRQWYLRAAEGAPTTRLNTREQRVAAAWQLLRGNVRPKYVSEDRELLIPAVGFALPLLVDRGLILASGRLPEWRSPHWTYFDIDPERARHVARILGASLEVTT